MTTRGIEVEGTTKGSERRPVARALSLSMASIEIFGIRGANRAGQSASVENVPASQNHDGGQIRVGAFHPAEQQTPVRHLVLFPAQVL